MAQVMGACFSMGTAEGARSLSTLAHVTARMFRIRVCLQ